MTLNHHSRPNLVTDSLQNLPPRTSRFVFFSFRAMENGCSGRTWPNQAAIPHIAIKAIKTSRKKLVLVISRYKSLSNKMFEN
jgi:hypothetical protein